MSSKPHMSRFTKGARALLPALALLVSLSPSLPVSAASAGDWQIGVKSADGPLTPYWVTLSNGQVLGKTGGVPAAITPLVSGDLTPYLTSATATTLYAPIAHAHIIGDVTGLQAALDAKLSTTTATTLYAPIAHAHIVGDVTGLQTALDAKLSTTTATTLYAPIAHAHIVGDVTGLQTALDAKEPTQTPASQAEAEAGTETALRSWSPVRVAQAIEALGAGSAASLPRGHIAGLTLSWVSNTVINISAGAARSRDDTTDIATPLSGFVNLQKSTSAWAQTAYNGTTGGLDTGSFAANTSYAVYVIYNPTTGLMDGLLSTNGTTPNALPSGYTQFRRIGWIRSWNASAAILSFTQTGDWFAFTSGQIPTSYPAISATVADYNVVAPLKCIADYAFISSSGNIYITNGIGTLAGSTGNDYNTSEGRNSGANGTVLVPMGSVSRLRMDAASGTPTVTLTLRGWIDHRGRHD